MCYKTTLTKKEEEIEQYRNTPAIAEGVYQPSFNVNGFTHPNLYIIPQDASSNYFPASWGLIPNHSIEDPEGFYAKSKYNTLNARDDKLFNSRIWKKSILNNRCLIFADGFYEPHHYNKKVQAYFCHIPNGDNIEDRELFTFAGIYTSDSEGSYYTSIITIDANPFFAEIHNQKKRMPLVLDRKYENDWLEEGQSEKIIKDLLIDGFTAKEFHAYPVTNDLYKSGVNKNTPDILKKVKSIETSTLF